MLLQSNMTSSSKSDKFIHFVERNWAARQKVYIFCMLIVYACLKTQTFMDISLKG